MKIKIINRSRHALPSYQTPLSAGMDLRANIEQERVLHPMERAIIPTGLYLALPAGYEARIGFLSFFVCRVDEANMFFGK